MKQYLFNGKTYSNMEMILDELDYYVNSYMSDAEYRRKMVSWIEGLKRGASEYFTEDGIYELEKYVQRMSDRERYIQNDKEYLILWVMDSDLDDLYSFLTETGKKSLKDFMIKTYTDQIIEL